MQPDPGLHSMTLDPMSPRNFTTMIGTSCPIIRPVGFTPFANIGRQIGDAQYTLSGRVVYATCATRHTVESTCSYKVRQSNLVPDCATRYLYIVKIQGESERCKAALNSCLNETADTSTFQSDLHFHGHTARQPILVTTPVRF